MHLGLDVFANGGQEMGLNWDSCLRNPREAGTCNIFSLSLGKGFTFYLLTTIYLTSQINRCRINVGLSSQGYPRGIDAELPTQNYRRRITGTEATGTLTFFLWRKEKCLIYSRKKLRNYVWT